MANPTYSTFQQDTFSLNLISNVSSLLYGDDQSSINTYTTNLVDDLLTPGNAVLSSMNDNSWQVVWGPVVFSTQIKDGAAKGGYEPMNTMYIARNSNQDYVVAIAGTSAKSRLDWTKEDFNVLTMQAWPYATPQNLNPQITSATAYGLSKLVALPDPKTSQIALDYLNSVDAKSIMVTGHSLGGTLAPCFALYLYNQMTNSPSISVMPVAGATPGDGQFATYYDNCLGASTTRFWNNYDIVPHADAPSLMELVCNLYKPEATLKLGNVHDDEFRLAVAAGITVGTAYGLTHVNATDPSFTVGSGIVTKVQSGCTLDPTNFFDQAIFQHIDAYAYFFNLANFQQQVTTVLNGATEKYNITPALKTITLFFNEGSVEPAVNLKLATA